MGRRSALPLAVRRSVHPAGRKLHRLRHVALTVPPAILSPVVAHIFVGAGRVPACRDGLAPKPGQCGSEICATATRSEPPPLRERLSDVMEMRARRNMMFCF